MSSATRVASGSEVSRTMTNEQGNLSPCSSNRRQEPWLGAAYRGCGSVANIPEAPFTSLEFRDRCLEITRRELRPHPRREDELRVGALPQQEVAEALLTTRTDQEVHIRYAARGVRRG